MTVADIKKCFSQFSQLQCTTLAASLAYYTAFALPPLLYLLVMVLTVGLSFFFDDQQSEIRARHLIEHQAVAASQFQRSALKRCILMHIYNVT